MGLGWVGWDRIELDWDWIGWDGIGLDWTDLRVRG